MALFCTIRCRLPVIGTETHTHTLTKLKTAQQAMVVDWFSQDGVLPNINKVLSAFSNCLISQHLTKTRQQISADAKVIPKLLRDADLCQLLLD